jgi:sigma-B regulation protein RsbU (phosphoserine phosphatase)
MIGRAENTLSKMRCASEVVVAGLPVHAIDDPQRLAAVARTGLLDTPPDPAFDDLTRLAAILVSAPLAFATIVDDRRSFWKSTFGLPGDAPRENTVEESFCQYVVRSRRELIVTDAVVDDRTRRNPSVAAMGVRAWAGFPLLAPDGEVLGSFCVVDTKPRAWTARDLEVLRTLSDAASREIALRAAIENERQARLHAEAVTQTLQASLLPPALPAVRGLDVAARFRPAGTGVELVGDFYDLFKVRGDRWAFMVGDICGKGLEAAKAASLARHTVGAAAMQREDPADVLTLLNETFLARRGGPDLFLTAIFGTLILCERDCRLALACAGHPAPIVRRADGTAAALEIVGPLIGVFAQLQITSSIARLAPGDALILYTDGVSEARRDGRLFGDEAILRVIEQSEPSADAAALACRIEEAALAFCGGTANDDIAILVLRVPA